MRGYSNQSPPLGGFDQPGSGQRSAVSEYKYQPESLGLDIVHYLCTFTNSEFL